MHTRELRVYPLTRLCERIGLHAQADALDRGLMDLDDTIAIGLEDKARAMRVISRFSDQPTLLSHMTGAI